MKKILLLISAVLVACSPAREEEISRSVIPQMEVANTQVISAKIQRPLQDTSSSAEARVQLLNKGFEKKGRFSYLEKIELDDHENLVGRIDIDTNPFVQYVLSPEVFKRDDLETFIKQVHEAHEKGELGTMEWVAFQAAEKAYRIAGSTWGLIKIQTRAINSKVEMAFPGVFGKVTPLEKSLSLMWLRKFDGALEPENSEIQRLLRMKLPLMASPHNEDLYTDFRRSMAAAAYFYPMQRERSLSSQEKAASFILFQRMWAQLLKIKGYAYADYSVVNGESAIQKLTDQDQAFGGKTRVGYFVDAVNNKAIALTPEDIASYNPAKRLLLFGMGTQTSEGRPQLANLGEEISFFGAMSLAFEASSPAAWFVKDPSQYLFGDVKSMSNSAIIPAEAHSLSFGLMAMQFQNLGARRIIKVNGLGQKLKVGESARGIVLIDDRNSVYLDYVLRLIEINLQLDLAISELQEMAERKPEQLQKMNTFYKDLNEMNKNFAKVRTNLKDLRLPLYFLAMEFVKKETTAFNWNPNTGLAVQVGADGKTLAPFSREHKRKTGTVLRDLGLYMNQPLIQAEAAELLK